ncbi:MAG: methionine ABC transporter ATP-binding protein [Oligoflexales bacterium]|nr:methionine ABC transporter ATP-binding protein [Oligoflexales bacterium]
MIRFKNVHKTYRIGSKEIVALNNIDLEVPEGSIFGMIGASGAGKSSLLRCVNGLESPDSGQVIVGDKDINSLSTKELRQSRKEMGMIFQHFNLLNVRNVFDNIALPLELSKRSASDIKEKVSPLIELTGLKGKETSYPNQLSGGQKQRVAIARALANDPKVLLCDEATSALDPQTTEQILNLLKDINKKLGITILLITHEVDVIKSICNYVALLDKGCLVETNKVVDFFSAPQSKLGKDYVNSSFSFTLPHWLEGQVQESPSNDHPYPLLKISFSGNKVNSPVISKASREFGIDINILLSNVEYIGSSNIGAMIAQVSGDADKLKQCLDYFANENLSVDIIGYVA